MLCHFSGHPDPEHWPKRVLSPAEGRLSVAADDSVDVVLDDLLPNKEYFIKVDLRIRREGEDEVVLRGEIQSARTATPTATTPASDHAHINEVDVQLAVKDVTAATALVSWRFFSSEEKRFIDGVQLR